MQSQEQAQSAETAHLCHILGCNANSTAIHGGLVLTVGEHDFVTCDEGRECILSECGVSVLCFVAPSHTSLRFYDLCCAFA